MDFIKITYFGAELEIPKFLLKHWPSEKDLSLDQWPTFCGAGEGFGDLVVPDVRCGVNVSCVCFVHDIGWAIADRDNTGFLKSNSRFFFNLRSLLLANSSKSRWKIEWTAFYYLLGVTTIGSKCFKSESDNATYIDPEDNPVVQDRLLRLKKALRDAGKTI